MVYDSDLCSEYSEHCIVLIMYLNKGRLQLTWPMIRALQFGARVDSEVEVAALKQNAVCICLSGCIY